MSTSSDYFPSCVFHTDIDNLGRRSFLSLGGLGAAALAAGAAPLLRTGQGRRFSGYPFSLGVASGDPLPTSVVLWTRLAPQPLAVDGSGGMDGRRAPVQWEMATDESFYHRVKRGATHADPRWGYSIHVEVEGLDPSTEYFYRFRSGSEISPVGRTKTAPPPGAHISSLAFAVASCQAWYDGYYTAYQHMVDEDLDFVVHLGDYIYEYGVGARGGVRDVTLPSQYQREAAALVEYRNRHALYRSDPHLQAAHAAFPWIVTLDDHEVENNWADEDSIEDTEPDQDPHVFLRRRAMAFRAYYEHMPLRSSSIPRGPTMDIYRRRTFGDLVEFNVLDTRQYRSDQACGDGREVGCRERLDPARTMTGDRQERWLLDGLARSGATWNVLAQQVVMTQLDHNPGPPQAFGMDLWDGYFAARERILGGLVARGVSNPMVLTGDVHRNLAANLKRDFDDPESATLGSELATTSVSSGGNGADMDQLGRDFLQANPHLKFHNAQRGFILCTVTPETWQADFRTLPYVERPDGPIYTRASFAIEAGNPGLQQVSDNPPQGKRYSSEVITPDYLLETKDAQRYQ